MVTVSQLESFNPGGLSAAAASFSHAAEGLGVAQRDIASANAQLAGWSGPAAARAHATVSRLSAGLNPAVASVGTVESAVSTFVAAVSNAKSMLAGALSAAQGSGCTVGPDGSVTAPPAPAVPAGGTANVPIGTQALVQDAVNQHNQVVAQARGWQQTIRQALQSATAADQAAAGTLEGALGGAGRLGTVVTGAA
ncbi:MAG: hypothetical protein M3137_10180 [Actinomycetota bacterium]|nr:hypothetical protein [Actinomycetota bacterium]